MQEQLLDNTPYSPARERAIELAQLDIILDSNYVGGAGGKCGVYASILRKHMYSAFCALDVDDSRINALVADSKSKYNLRLK